MNNSWDKLFEENEDLLQSIENKIDWSKKVYPSKENIYRVFNMDIKDIHVVIIGQDPYHQSGQAQGLSFSVPTGFKLPPSLKNIFKAIKSQTGSESNDGDLTRWEKQGVFLLNRSLSVYDSQANSHSKFGWKEFTLNTIKYLNDNKRGVVYMLWGNDAISLSNSIDNKNNLVLTSVHPSPLSAYRGFYENEHFIKANDYLKNKIDW